MDGPSDLHIGVWAAPQQVQRPAQRCTNALKLKLEVSPVLQFFSAMRGRLFPTHA